MYGEHVPVQFLKSTFEQLLSHWSELAWRFPTEPGRDTGPGLVLGFKNVSQLPVERFYECLKCKIKIIDIATVVTYFS